jgi:hypothetical protein
MVRTVSKVVSVTLTESTRTFLGPTLDDAPRRLSSANSPPGPIRATTRSSSSVRKAMHASSHSGRALRAASSTRRTHAGSCCSETVAWARSRLSWPPSLHAPSIVWLRLARLPKRVVYSTLLGKHAHAQVSPRKPFSVSPRGRPGVGPSRSSSVATDSAILFGSVRAVHGGGSLSRCPSRRSRDAPCHCPRASLELRFHPGSRISRSCGSSSTASPSCSTPGRTTCALRQRRPPKRWTMSRRTPGSCSPVSGS